MYFSLQQQCGLIWVMNNCQYMSEALRRSSDAIVFILSRRKWIRNAIIATADNAEY